MTNPDARYELKDGKFLVNGEAIPLRKGIIYAALARAGWTGYEGPVSREFLEKLLRVDRRISIYALARELETSAA